jgi:molybdopterin converting factor small subunit
MREMLSETLCVSYLGLARNIVDAEGESLHVRSSMTVGGLLEILCERHGPQFRHGIYRSSGQLRSFIQICVDDRDIDDLQGLRTPLDNGGEVSIVIGVYPLEGG